MLCITLLLSVLHFCLSSPPLCVIDGCPLETPRQVDPISGRTILTMGVFDYTPGDDTNLIVEFAVQKNIDLYLPDYTIKLVRNVTGCSPSVGLLSAVQMFASYPDLVGVLGGVCTGVSKEVALLGAAFNMTQISPASNSGELSDNSQYPFFLRTIGRDSFQANGWIGICQKYNWTKVVVLSSREPVHNLLIQQFTRAANGNHIEIVFSDGFDGSVGADPTQPLLNIKSKLVNVIFLACYYFDAQTVFRKAAELGMIGGSSTNVFVVNDAALSTPETIIPGADKENRSLPEYIENWRARDNYREWLRWVIALNPSDDPTNITKEVVSEYNRYYNKPTNYTPSTYSYFMYDAVLTMLKGLRFFFY